MIRKDVEHNKRGKTNSHPKVNVTLCKDDKEATDDKKKDAHHPACKIDEEMQQNSTT